MGIFSTLDSPDIQARIQEVTRGEPAISRRELSRRICEWTDWRDANGRLKTMGCRVALLRMERAGLLTLPPPQPFPIGAGEKRKPRLDAALGAVAEWTGRLAEAGDIRLERVVRRGSSEARVWMAMMERDHYLGAGPLCGAQLRYLVRSERHGYMGGLAWSAAAWRVAARDRWIGWTDRGRAANLHRVVCNSRFLIVPSVRVPHLASHVLGLSVRHLAQDWEQRYGYRPLLAESYVDVARFRGTCYRAANWVEVGQTQGRGRQDRNHASVAGVKAVYLYELEPEARAQLVEGDAADVPEVSSRSYDDWTDEEFGDAELGDKRLTTRVQIVAAAFYARPQGSVPQACGTPAKTKAAYRLFDHPEVTMKAILAPHYEATKRRLSAYPVVLAVQDTTSLNYSAQPHIEGLGPIGARAEGEVGLHLHSTLAFEPQEGTPLGLLDVQCWRRDAAQFGQSHRRKQRPIEEKESNKWLLSYQAAAKVQQACPTTRVVCVGDREADLYDLFALACRKPQGPALLVRAEYDRCVTDEEKRKLWQVVESQPEGGRITLRVPRKKDQSAREATLTVRWTRVELKAPWGAPKDVPVRLWAVLAQEVKAPQGVSPLEWMLLTTLQVTTFEEAGEKIQWYSRRWGIEVFHKTLKSGCRIEQRQLGHADRIEACLAIDLVVAWRVYYLTKLGRETPNVPCTVFFEESEWKALVCYTTRQPVSPAQPPTLREAVRMVAGLGGFLGRKGDGEPGTKSMWIGLQRLDDLASMYTVLATSMRPRAP
jgi:hypothetical protein